VTTVNQAWIRNGVAGLVIILTALVLLAQLLSGAWVPAALILGAVVLTWTLVQANFPAYLAFGILAPVSITLPFVRLFPTYAVVLGLCVLAAFGRRVVAAGPGVTPLRSYDRLTLIFYGYLLVRYLMHPVLPGYALGLSEDITGFRSWFDHLIGFATVLFLGYLLRTRDDLRRCCRWLLVAAFVFTAISVPLMFIPSLALTRVLHTLGVYIVYFSNGWRRFVFLPGLGVILLSASLLPRAFGLRPWIARLLLPFGVMAIVAGANRSSLLAVLTMVVAIWIVQRRYLRVVLLAAMVAALVWAVDVAYQRRLLTVDHPFIRLMGVFNPRITDESGGAETIEWRLMRWRRALEDIRNHPWVGVGYGVLPEFFAVTSEYRSLSPELEVERDLATGSTHNGYISAARSLGIPAVVLFAIIMGREVWRCLRAGRRLAARPEEAELHLFLGSYLLMYLAVLWMAAEIRNPPIWLFLALSMSANRLAEHAPSAEAPAAVTGGEAVPGPVPV